MSDSMFSHQFQLYIGNGNLEPKRQHTVSIFGLRSRQFTQAFIDGLPVEVNYLVTVNSNLDLQSLEGPLYVGGYQNVLDLKVSACNIIWT